MPDIDREILDDKQRLRIRASHWQACWDNRVDWRTRALAAEEYRAKMEPLVLQLCDEFAAAVRHHETRGAGGQQVSYLGPFASVGPSVVGEMRRWLARLSDATAPTKEHA